MDMATLGAAISIVKKMPDKSIAEAIAAADRAEAAAEQIEGLNYEITVSGTKLAITERGE